MMQIRLVNTWAGQIPVGCMKSSSMQALTREQQISAILDYVGAHPDCLCVKIAEDLALNKNFVMVQCWKAFEKGVMERSKHWKGYVYRMKEGK